MRALTERRLVEKLVARGISDCAIGAITGVPPSTIGNWRRHPDRGPREKEPLEEWHPPDPAAYSYQPKANLVRVVASSPLWRRAFPQHGPGRKHARPIELVEWQLEITHALPRQLLRGLIHSDGCRTTNRFKVKLPSGRVGEYEYPRYFFSNLSEDIRRIFCDHCELLGIRWTQSDPRNISVSHRKSVALLDEFVGPKW
jgi:hypothetical protein